MSTNANIKIIHTDGTQTGVYLHFDGYTENAGFILQCHYNTPEKVESLLSLGDLSNIGATLEDCTVYHRDEDEPFHQTNTPQEYNYIYNELLKVWFVEMPDYTKSEAAELLEVSEECTTKKLLLAAIMESGDLTPIQKNEAINAAQEARQKEIAEIIEAEQFYYNAYCN